MKAMKSMTAAAFLLSLVAMGCQDESAPGGPGVEGGKTVAEQDTFVLKVPSMAVDLEQGQQEEITISVDRGENFDQVVTLEFTAPAGVTVTPQTVEVQAAEDETKIQVQADATAQQGEAVITVNATPETGEAVSHEVKVNVNVADNQDGTQPQGTQNQSQQGQTGAQGDSGRATSPPQNPGPADNDTTSAPPANPGQAPQP